LGITAQGLPNLTRTTPVNDIRKLLEIAGQHKVEKIIVGLPKNMNGTLGKSAEQVLNFVQGMKVKTAIPIDLWDERLSTVAVTRTLISANVSRRRRKDVVDKLAAVYILQGFLDSQRRLN
jgi:putative holliday junction resolvase